MFRSARSEKTVFPTVFRPAYPGRPAARVVSIRTRAPTRGKPPGQFRDRIDTVSIRTRAPTRGKHNQGGYHLLFGYRFNPHPGTDPGKTPGRWTG